MSILLKNCVFNIQYSWWGGGIDPLSWVIVSWTKYGTKKELHERIHSPYYFFYYLKIKLLVLLQPLSWLLWSHSEHDICQFLCFSLSLTFYEREILNNNRCSYSSSLGQLSIFIIVQKLHLECLNRPQQTLTLILLLKALCPVQH